MASNNKHDWHVLAYRLGVLAISGACAVHGHGDAGFIILVVGLWMSPTIS